MKKISRLHFITTSAAIAEQACAGGTDWVQLRLKNVSYEEYREVALEVQAICRKYEATFIVNDNIKLALDIHADGVHAGKEDMLPQEDIEEMLRRGGIIGRTANTIEDIIHLQGKPVSYIGFGPYRFTTTKQKLSPIVGIDGYCQLFAEIKEKGLTVPPVIGIGGITAGDVAELLTAGLYGIAVSGAISGAADITTAAETFNELVKSNEHER